MIKIYSTWFFALILFANVNAGQMMQYQKLLEASAGNTVWLANEGWLLQVNDTKNTKKINIPFVLENETDRGVFQYRFTVPDSVRGRSLRLHLTGISGRARIRLNKTLLAEHPNSINPFHVDIAAEQLLVKSANLLEIDVSLPFINDIDYNGYIQLYREKRNPGIVRAVYLEWLNPVRFDNFQHKLSGGEIEFNYSIIDSRTVSENASDENKIRLRLDETIYSKDGKKIFNRVRFVDKQAEHRIRRKTSAKNFHLWSPNSPAVYRIQLKLTGAGGELARLTKNIVFRRLETRQNRFYLNDGLLRIKGITYREFFSSNADIKKNAGLLKDLLSIKSAGFNAVRFPFSVPHPAAFAFADSIGLLLFFESPVWRQTDEFFLSDISLQNAKLLADEIMNESVNYGSAAAFALAHEIPLENPAAQKYILILNEYLKQRYDRLTYVSPLQIAKLPLENVTDFYTLNYYDRSVFSLFKNGVQYLHAANIPLLLGNCGYSVIRPFRNLETTAAEKMQVEFFEEIFTFLKTSDGMQGYFVDSFRDWPGVAEGVVTQVEDGKIIYPYGLFRYDGSARFIFTKITELLNGNFTSKLLKPVSREKTNFFSTTIFLFMMIFLIVYRQSYSFRENLSRAMRHAYGFFVDLRDRRIVSWNHSSLVGLLNAFVSSAMISAFLYYYRDNLAFDEILSVFLVPINAKTFYLEIARHHWQLFLFFLLLFLSWQFLLALIIKFIGFLIGRRFRFRQAVAVTNWSGVPLVILSPVSMFSYQLAGIPELHSYVFYALVIFFLWINIRFANGSRVLLELGGLKAHIILAVLYVSVLMIVMGVFEAHFKIIDYITLLWQVQIFS